VITIVTTSKTSTLTFCLAYERGVFAFKFLGDKEFVGASQTWTWVGVDDDAPLVQSVRAGTVILLSVNSLNDCLENDQTFFYNQTDGRLYVHWLGSQGDYSIGRGTAALQESSLFYANGVDRVARGYYDNTLYEPKIQNVSGFSIQADPIKFGLVARANSQISLVNANGFFDNSPLNLARGQVVEVFTAESNVDTLQDASLVFKGFTKSLGYNQEGLNIEIEEQRFFLNGPVCPNVYSSVVGLKEKYIGKPKPVAFGDIRRGITVPLDSDGVGKDDAATITFQVADPEFGPLRAITGLFDSNGNAVTLGTIDLNACTVEYSKAAGEDVDLDKFSWEGEGYELEASLTYNNGLDIMRAAFDYFGNTPFLNSTFDLVAWTVQTLANTQPVGLSVLSTKGFVENIIEPITVSLQGVVITTGTGLITFLNRDTEAVIKSRFAFDELLSRPSVKYDTESFVSSVAVEFSRDFAEREAIVEEDTTLEESVIRDYGLKTRGDISPVESVLANRADAVLLGEEIMRTSQTPDRICTFIVKVSNDTMDLNPFDLVDVDLGRFGSPDRKKVEVLSISPDYNRYEVTISGRILEDIDDDLAAPSLYGPGLYGVSVYGG
jgi:hypothetical protein